MVYFCILYFLFLGGGGVCVEEAGTEERNEAGDFKSRIFSFLDKD